jgi:hypothetical protein
MDILYNAYVQCTVCILYNVIITMYVHNLLSNTACYGMCIACLEITTVMLTGV